jgi:hypothetical protein
MLFTIAHSIEKANFRQWNNYEHEDQQMWYTLQSSSFICGLSIGNRYVNPLMNELKDGGRHSVT